MINLEGSLGLDRADMPQIPSSHQDQFEDWLKGMGVSVDEDIVDASELKPIQHHISRERIEHVKEGIAKQIPKLIEKEQYISRDGYILDGHHRWAAFSELGMDIPVKRIDMAVEALLDVAGQFNDANGIEGRGVESQAKHLGPGPHPNGSPQSIHGMAGRRGKAKRQEIISQPSSAYPVANEKGTDTLERFTEKEGKPREYTKERAELHEAIYAEMLSGGKVKNKEFTILGGGAASGKSTLINNGYIDVKHAVVINADDIKGQLPEYREMLAEKDSRAAAFAHEESSEISKEAMKRAATSGFDYLLDGTGDSTLESLRRKTSVAHANGYAVNARYVTVDTATAEARNLARAEKTGRMVPPAALRHAHQQVSVIFPQAIKEGLFDSASLYDTNDSTMDEDRTELVASFNDGKLTIHNDSKWERFLAKAEGN